jgi:hypothetical protein
MFTVTRHSENRLDIAMSGRLDSEAMKIALDELVSQSSDIEDGTMLYDVVDFQLPSLSAIAIEFSRLPSMFGFLKKFRRAAVLTDKAWLKKVSELEAVLYPGLEIRAFDRDQREAAEAWLSET